MAETTMGKEGLVRRVMNAIGLVRNEVVGEDPKKAAKRLEREGQQTTIVNPTGLKVATGILGAPRQAEKAIDKALNETVVGKALNKLGSNPK